MLAGLIANAGVGMLVLFRVHNKPKTDLLILFTVYGTGILIGILCDLFQIVI